jgi:two-component sensor histidine kinase
MVRFSAVQLHLCIGDATRERIIHDGWVSMRNYALGLALRYAVSLILVGLIVYGMVAWVPDAPSQYYAWMLGALLCITMVAGRGPGYAALAFGALAVALFALRGAGFAVADPVDATGLVGLIAAGVLIVAVVGRTRERLAFSREQAQVFGEENAGLRAIVSEFSHRLRNDLSGLIATAQLRSAVSELPETREALGAMGDRINALAAVYARLDTGRGGSAAIGLRVFIEGLCEDLRFAHLSVRPIGVAVDVMDVSVRAGRAVLIGLVVNELLTNASKYAFPDDRPGTITVTLHDHPARTGIWQLKVVDDGVGFRDARVAESGLGQKLMKARASQLGGTFSLARLDGFTVGQLDFPKGDGPGG